MRRVDTGAGAAPSCPGGTTCAFSLIGSFVTKRCPSLTRSISIAMDSTACSTLASRSSDAALKCFDFSGALVRSR